MSGFVETLAAPKIHHLARTKEQDDRKKKMKGGDAKHDDHAMLKSDNQLDLGPHLCSINRDKDKGGKITPRMKKYILERMRIPVVAETSRVQDVEMVGISIACPARPAIVLSKPFTSSPKAYLFTLKEGTKYSLSFSFIVSNKLVSGLKYENTLWKAGIRVDKCNVMLGTYSPREKAYIFELEEETLPCGILVRGLYAARTKVSDSEGKCYMDIHYYFNISKTWPRILRP